MHIDVSEGCKYLEFWYDEKMSGAIQELGMHGIDINNPEHCKNPEYRMYLHRKTKGTKPRKLEIDKQYADRVNAAVNKEIAMAMRKRKAKNGR